MSAKPSIETSELLRRITDAIERLEPKQGRLRISVAREPKWEKSPSTSDEVLVRWLCWSMEDGEEEILPPEFEVLSPHVTEDQLRHELPGFFPTVEVIIDDDIEV